MIRLKYPLIVTLTLLAGLLAGSGCSNENSPRDVAENFLSYYGKNEFDQAKQYGTEETDRLLDMMNGFNKMMADSLLKERRYEIISEKVEGNVATVVYRESDSNEPSQSMTLIREDGKWMVSMNKESINASEGEEMDAGATSTDSETQYDTSSAN